MSKTEWAGRWLGGRFRFLQDGTQVFFIEKMRGGIDYNLKLPTDNEEIAKGMFGMFEQNPVAFARGLQPAREEAPDLPVYITDDRINLYMQHIRKSVDDHKNARRSYLLQWSERKVDLAHTDKGELRKTLATWDGGHRGRVEALNAFANFLVRDGEQGLKSWKRFENPYDPKATRAERVIYSLEQLKRKYDALGEGRIRDLFYLRAATGMHQTEIDQLEKIKILDGLLPDKGTGLRILDDTNHQIRAVIQVTHKSRKRHRVSLDEHGLECALRLVKGVPNRVTVWKALNPLIPSNLRHTFVTQLGEVGRLVTWKDGGLPRALVAQLVGHRAGSTMTADRYENLQVPPMGWIPLLD
jgi:hypothetical protein